MGHSIEISDETYAQIVAIAARQDTQPGALVEAWLRERIAGELSEQLETNPSDLSWLEGVAEAIMQAKSGKGRVINSTRGLLDLIGGESTDALISPEASAWMRGTSVCEVAPRFLHDLAHLTSEQRQQFALAMQRFQVELAVGFPAPRGVGVGTPVGTEVVYPMRFAEDGWAAFMVRRSALSGDSHMIWLSVGPRGE